MVDQTCDSTVRLSENQRIVLDALRQFTQPASTLEVALRISFPDLNPFANTEASGEWDRHEGRVVSCLSALKKKGVVCAKRHFRQGPLWFIRTITEKQEDLF